MLINRGYYFFWHVSALQDAAVNNVLTNKKGTSLPSVLTDCALQGASCFIRSIGRSLGCFRI